LAQDEIRVPRESNLHVKAAVPAAWSNATEVKSGKRSDQEKHTNGEARKSCLGTKTHIKDK